MQAKERRTFNRSTVQVESHGSNGPYNPLPAVNVKVRTGFESLKPEDWESIRATVRDYEASIPEDVLARFGPDWIEERFALSDYSGRGAAGRKQAEFYEAWYSDACSQGFEQAEEAARELFGSDVECYSAGRSGGWLVVKGLPNVEDWDTEDGYPIGSMPTLKGSSLEGARFSDGTELDCEAGLFERWAFFVELCEGLAAETPTRCADLVGLNVFAREEALREVEYLRALPSGQWDSFKLAVPCKVQGGDALAEHAVEHAPELKGVSVSAVAVLNDPSSED